MEAILLSVHILLALALIGLVLIQHGKGADVGASFGSGGSNTIFGARGAGSFLTKLTTVIAITFFATSLSLAYIASHKPTETSLMDSLNATQEEAPASVDEKAAPVEAQAEELPVIAVPDEAAPKDVPKIEP